MAEVSAQLIETPAGEPDALVVELPEGETAGASEAPASEAVEIAQIEADRDITIAAIHAETEQAHIEARSESEERDEQWRDVQDRLASLTEQVATLAAGLALLSTPPALPVAVVEEPAPEPGTEELPGTETNLTPQSTKDETSETPTEAIDVSEAEKPEAPEPPRRKVRFL